MKRIRKCSDVSTNVIQQIVQYINGYYELDLNILEKMFFDIDISSSTPLSLTLSQKKEHQLRFIGKEYGEELINSVAVKIAELPQQIELAINIFNLSYPERLFIDRLNELLFDLGKSTLNIYNEPQHYDSGLDFTYENMRNFQIKGDMWTARIIGDYLIEDESFFKSHLFLLHHSFNYSCLGDKLAAERILATIIDSPLSDRENMLIKTHAMYALAMLKLRSHISFYRSDVEGVQLLNDAYKMLLKYNDHSIDYKFTMIFNRNGYALYLFKSNKLEEAIELINNLIKEIEELVEENSYAKLHQVVLYYNLYQLYRKKGDFSKAVNAIETSIALDPNDWDHKYNYISLLFEFNELEKAKQLLDEMQKDQAYDIVIHNSYYSYYFMMKEDFVTAELFAYKAYMYSSKRYNMNNELLYNLLVCLCNNNKFGFAKKLKYTGIKGKYSTEIKELLSEI